MSLPTSRRAFIAGLAATGVGLAAAAYGWLGRGARPDWWYRWRWNRRSPPALPRGTPGSLDSATARGLGALPEALVGRSLEPGRYSRFFDHRAAHHAGYRRLYRDFVRQLDADSRRRHGRRFAELEVADRRELLLAMELPTRRPTAKQLSRLSLQTARYERFITREVIRMFDATDAWIFAGYPRWPGQPRGLGYYQQAVSGSPR